jgi:hypothetical protein
VVNNLLGSWQCFEKPAFRSRSDQVECKYTDSR